MSSTKTSYAKKQEPAEKGIIFVSPVCASDIYKIHKQQDPNLFNSTVPFSNQFVVEHIPNNFKTPTQDNTNVFDNGNAFPSYYEMMNNPLKNNTKLSNYQNKSSRVYSKLRSTLN